LTFCCAIQTDDQLGGYMAQAYLSSNLFTKDVVDGLKPLLSAEPEIRIYSVD
jgi:hypothetical protein